MACFIPFPQDFLIKTTKNIHLTRNVRWISMEILRISQGFVSGKNHTPRHCARSSPMWASAWAAWAMARDSGVCSRPTGSWWRPWGGDEEVLAEREFCWQIIGQWGNDGENHGTNQGKMMGTLLKKWNFEEGNPRSKWRFFWGEIMEKSGRNQVSQQMSTVALCLKMSWGFN